MTLDWIAIVSGFGVGAIVGLTGVGGGSLMTPLLVSVFSMLPPSALCWQASRGNALTTSWPMAARRET